MNIAILGNGKEGQSAEKYFNNLGEKTQIFDNFKKEDIPGFHLENYDLVMRSPSVPPVSGFAWSSITKFFFDNCPCKIIGVTGTKGKGTTCSIIKSVLEALGEKVWLVGNIGTPALDVLEQIQPSDVVVYEMSSFQLWDLEESPHIAVVLRIEPDHLNVHKDFDDYVSAKSNIARHQTAEDYCIFYKNNSVSEEISALSSGTKIPYPIAENRSSLDMILDSLAIPGAHNRENAEAALSAVAAYYKTPVLDFVEQNAEKIKQGLANFKGLPHRLEFLRELNGVKYYDDNFSTALPSTKVAVEAFPNDKIVLILGGRDKTGGAALPEIADFLKSSANIAKVILIGESGHEIKRLYDDVKFETAESLLEAIEAARCEAETIGNSVVLMSPSAASFDMFENVYDRGAKYQAIVKDLR